MVSAVEKATLPSSWFSAYCQIDKKKLTANLILVILCVEKPNPGRMEMMIVIFKICSNKLRFY